ncbi:hypothetical protein [Pararhodonellum marinum]|uniref:hypothetical protein n=1 Tax=Pararhodonellum marinum TaxID=2755358 RepID=UPI00188FD8B4|nr:hypothetical protein [Pararhodonellum marinum]
MKFWFSIWGLIITSTAVLGQATEVYQGSTVYLGKYIGDEHYEFVFDDTVKIKNGFYTFESRLITEAFTGEINQLSVDGRFRNGKFDGVWDYKLLELQLEIEKLNLLRNVTLSYEINGFESSTKFNFNEGLANGLWFVENRKIESNRRLNEQRECFLSFDQGLAVGNFGFDSFSGTGKVTGDLNEEGFLEGQITFEYIEDGHAIKEIREYSDGFLLKIIKYSQEDNVLLEELIYDDVMDQLEKKNGKFEGIDFTISEEGFGILFQNGYNEEDPKLTTQKNGNSILFDLISRFERYSDRTDTLESKPPIYNFTRRFKFVYPETDDSLTNVLQPVLNSMVEEYNDFLSNPRIILNRQRIDSLDYIFGFIDQSRRNVDRLIDVVDLMKEGYFDFLYRPNYFPNGIPGLNRQRNFIYESNGGEVEAPFDIGVFIDSPDALLEQMVVYTKTLQAKTDDMLSYLSKEIRIFDQQATIDTLDLQIVQKKAKTDALYSYFSIIPEGKKIEDMPLDYRLYRIITNNLIQDLQAEYLDEENFDTKVSLGEEIVCVLEFFEDNLNNIKEIENMPDELDRKFTRYSPNPFFERDIETKILPAIYQKGAVRLYEHYLDRMFGSRSCEEIKRRFNRFGILNSRLLDLSSRSDEQEVQRLDRALRRENVPTRIARLLNL